MKRFLPLFLLLFCLSTQGASYYVSTNGTGDGSIGSPWPIAIGASNSTVQTGDTVWLRGGTYSIAGDHPYVYLQSPLASGVTFRPYAGEIAIIDGAFYVWQVNDTIIRDIIFIRSSANRISTEAGSAPSDIAFADTVSGFSTNMSLINCTAVNSIGNFCMFNDYSWDALIYGCIGYGGGWQGADRGHGHMLYAQGAKRAYNNASIAMMDYGIQIYGAEALLTNINCSMNIISDNSAYSHPSAGGQFLVGGGNAAGGIICNSNSIYNSPWVIDLGATTFYLGYGSTTNFDFHATNNYIVGKALLQNFGSGDFAGNTVYTASHDPMVWLNIPSPNTYIANNWSFSGNTYWEASLSTPFKLVGSTYSFTDWKTATGKDADSTFNTAAPTVNVVNVYPNDYEPGRAHVVVYNWANSDNVSVDVSSFMTNGEPYEIRHMMDPLGSPTKWGTWTSGTVSFPMTNLTVANIPGALNQPTNTAPAFGAFLVLTSGRFPNAQNGGVGGESGSSPTAPPWRNTWKVTASIKAEISVDVQAPYQGWLR